MKKLFILIALILSSTPAFAKMKIVTTTTDLAAIAKEVVQDKAEVKSLARGDQDPHFLEAKPSYAVLINQADLVVAVGLELEVGWLPVLLNQARNPKVQVGAPGFLDASKQIRPIEIPTGAVDRSMGDVHPHGNPHYWLDPNNGLRIAIEITDKLVTIDPENRSFYLQNLKNFEDRLKAKIAEWRPRVQKLDGKSILTYHRTFSYFTDWAGMFVRGYIEPKPGIPPSPGHLMRLIEAVKRDQIRLIVTENFHDPKAGEQIARQSGAKAIVLPASVDGEAAVKTYFDLFDAIIARLEAAL